VPGSESEIRALPRPIVSFGFASSAVEPPQPIHLPFNDADWQNYTTVQPRPPSLQRSIIGLIGHAPFEPIGNLKSKWASGQGKQEEDEVSRGAESFSPSSSDKETSNEEGFVKKIISNINRLSVDTANGADKQKSEVIAINSIKVM